MSKYSIWLTPETSFQEVCHKIIAEQAAHFSAPTFEPHITILGTVPAEQADLSQKLQDITAAFSKLQLTVSEISISTTYFQCVFARIKPIPELLDLQIAIKKAVQPENTAFYMPHISLIYGDLSMSERYQAAEKIRLPQMTFMANRVEMTSDTTDEPEAWKAIESFPLK